MNWRNRMWIDFLALAAAVTLAGFSTTPVPAAEAKVPTGYLGVIVGADAQGDIHVAITGAQTETVAECRAKIVESMSQHVAELDAMTAAGINVRAPCLDLSKGTIALTL